jgi:hypothetical protein
MAGVGMVQAKAILPSTPNRFPWKKPQSGTTVQVVELQSQDIMKNFLLLGCLELAIVTGAHGQSADTNTVAGPAPAPPTNTLLELSNVTGDLKVLDVNGLVLETNFVFLPRIKLSDLSTPELHALLENKTAYTALTVFGEIHYRNSDSVALENQLQKVWAQGRTLAEKIQTRLEILDAMRAYNYEVAALPATEALASQNDLYSNNVNARWALKADATVSASAQVENAEEARAYGDASRHDVHDARDIYEESAERLARADNRVMVANNQSATAHQMVADRLTRCAALSARLASYGITVAGSPPFAPIPPLSLGQAVDAERMVN